MPNKIQIMRTSPQLAYFALYIHHWSKDGLWYDMTRPYSTVMTISFQTDRPGQTVQTQIRLLLQEQSDQGLHCLQFPLHLLDALHYGKAILLNF